MTKKPLSLYTKSGDAGRSSLINGSRFNKHHPIFEALGTIDELNSHLGLAITLTPTPKLSQELHTIQHTLLTIGALLAGSTKPRLTKTSITKLEKRIDYYQTHTAKKWYTNFLLPGGSPIAAQLDVTRSACRRAERRLIALENNPDFLDLRISNFEFLRAYLNRLSDYFFALRCYANSKAKVKETKFTP